MFPLVIVFALVVLGVILFFSIAGEVESLLQGIERRKKKKKYGGGRRISSAPLPPQPSTERMDSSSSLEHNQTDIAEDDEFEDFAGDEIEVGQDAFGEDLANPVNTDDNVNTSSRRHAFDTVLEPLNTQGDFVAARSDIMHKLNQMKRKFSKRGRKYKPVKTITSPWYRK